MFLAEFESAVGAAFGMSKAGIGIAGLGTFKPELIMKVSYLPAKRRVILLTYPSPVPHTCRHVWYNRRLWPRCVRTHRWFTFVCLSLRTHLN